MYYNVISFVFEKGNYMLMLFWKRKVELMFTPNTIRRLISLLSEKLVYKLHKSMAL